MLKEIELLYQYNENRYGVFMYEVDKEDYPAYLQMIPFEMNIEMIQKRLTQMYYRHLQVIFPPLLIQSVKIFLGNSCRYAFNKS